MNATDKIKFAIEGLKKAFENATENTVTMEKFLEVTTSEGKVFVIEGEEIVVGAMVTDAGNTVMDADYQLADGTIITVVGGAITAVSEAPEIEVEVENSDKKLDEMYNSLVAKIEEAEANNAVIIAELKAENESLKVELSNHKVLIEETFKAVQIIGELPQEVELPKKENFASERTVAKKEAKANAIELIRKVKTI